MNIAPILAVWTPSGFEVILVLGVLIVLVVVVRASRRRERGKGDPS